MRKSGTYRRVGLTGMCMLVTGVSDSKAIRPSLIVMQRSVHVTVGSMCQQRPLAIAKMVWALSRGLSG